MITNSHSFIWFSGEPFNPAHLFNNAVANIICQMVFGRRFEYDDENFQTMLKNLIELAHLEGSIWAHVGHKTTTLFFLFLTKWLAKGSLKRDPQQTHCWCILILEIIKDMPNTNRLKQIHIIHLLYVIFILLTCQINCRTWTALFLSPIVVVRCLPYPDEASTRPPQWDLQQLPIPWNSYPRRAGETQAGHGPQQPPGLHGRFPHRDEEGEAILILSTPCCPDPLLLRPIQTDLDRGPVSR